MNMNVNGHDRYREANPSRVLNNPLVYAQRQQQMQQQQQQQQLQREATRSMAIGEMMERARLAAMNTNNTNNSRSQSPAVGNNPGMSSQFMDAIQRSDQIPIVDSHQKQQQQQRANQSPSSPLDNNASPSSSGHHPSQSRQNRPARHYPRPPCLNTWQGRGPGRDEFGGMMSDREKQWVVKIQLHQVSQTKEEVSRSRTSHSSTPTFFASGLLLSKMVAAKASNAASARQPVQSARSTRPIHQLSRPAAPEIDPAGERVRPQTLESHIELLLLLRRLAERLSQTSAQASFSNVNPSQTLAYASPLTTQLGKQSTATPRHPKCILHLDGNITRSTNPLDVRLILGQFSLGTRANAITHDKYNLGLLLNIENLHQDIMRLDDDDDDDAVVTPVQPESTTPSSSSSVSKRLLNSVIARYLNHPTYFFADMFGQFGKGQIIVARLSPYLLTTTGDTTHLELMLVRLYGSLSYMVRRWPNSFRIEPIVMNMIGLMQQQVHAKKATFEQLLAHVYTYYDEQIKPKLLESDAGRSTAGNILMQFVVVCRSTCQSICRSRPLHELVHGDDDDRAALHVGTSILFAAGRELVGLAHSNHAAVAAAIAVSTVRARAATRE